MSGRTPEQLKHLDLVQTNIARMHDASTSMKRFAVVALALGGALARYVQDAAIMGLTMAVVLAFWLLDAKYLQVERAYRDLYESVRRQGAGEAASFELTPGKVGLVPLRELWSWSTYLLYGPLLVLLALTWLCTDWEPREEVRSENGTKSVLQLSLQAGQLASLASQEHRSSGRE